MEISYICSMFKNTEKKKSYYLRNKEKLLAQSKEYRSKRPRGYNNTASIMSRYRKFGLTLEDYNKLLLHQNNKCAVCRLEETSNNNRRLSLDHSHKTNKIRGLLCARCNTALGMLRDDIDTVQSLLAYLIFYN